MGNDGHVPNVLRVVHETTDLCASQYSILPLLPISMCCAGRCVRGTYLLDGEAAILLAKSSIDSTNRDGGPQVLERAEEGGGDLLDHFGGVVTIFFYENSVVGSSRIPRSGAWVRCMRREVELMTLSNWSTEADRRKVD